MHWKAYFSYLDSLTPALVLLLILILHKYRRILWTKQDKLLLIFLTVQLVLNGLAITIELTRIFNNNLWLYHLNCLLTQAIFAAYFFQLFQDKARRRFVLYTSIVFLLAFIANILFVQPITTFNSYTYALGAFFTVTYGFVCFYKWMQGLPAFNILALKEFWGAAGVLFYFGSSFFIFISYEYLIRVTPKTVSILWMLHNVFLMIACIIFARAILAKEWIHESSLSSAPPYSRF
jgi:hypothetical protein